MMFADGLTSTWHQEISNLHDDMGQLVQGVLQCDIKGFEQKHILPTDLIFISVGL